MAENVAADYELAEIIGESETTTLFKGRHLRLTERVRAVKTPRFGSDESPQAFRLAALKEVFIPLCETAAQVALACDTASAAERPAAAGVVFVETVHFNPDADMEPSDKPYIVSEWMSGGSLADLLAKGPLAPPTALQMVSGILQTLHFLHEKGVVHGNLKPGNILLTAEGIARLTDFGGNVLARGMPPRFGSLPYLSPEQSEARDAAAPLDARADLFTLTLLLYEMLTGRRPGRLLTAAQMPSALNAQVPPAFDDLIVQGLQIPLNQRFRSAQTMRERLLEAMAERRSAAPSVTAAETMAATPSDTPAPSPLPAGYAPLDAPIAAVVHEPAPPDAAPAAATRSLGDRRTNEADGAEMLWVPGGVLTMGSDERDAEKPIHEVVIKGFWIYRFPVTQKTYREYMTAVNPPSAPPSVLPPTKWQRGDAHASKPVAGLKWRAADAYAQWAKARLPTEAEWEWAARGPEGRRYPWGNEWDKSCANTRESGHQAVTEVSDYLSGASWCGAVDLIGNVFEWCHSLYRPYPYDAQDGREDAYDSGARVLRGGSAVTPSEGLTAMQRATESGATTLTGFRLAMDGE